MRIALVRAGRIVSQGSERKGKRKKEITPII